MSGKKGSRIFRTDGRDVEISNPEKILFPEAEITKGELVEYYDRIAETVLTYLKDRPVSMERYPDGIGEEGFYQKELPEHFPDWIDSAEAELMEGGSQRQVLCNDRAALVYLADQACVTPHVWLSLSGDLDRPDRMIFDLDPSTRDPAEAFPAVREAARRLRDVLQALGLSPFSMLTGSKGLHVTVPLVPEADFDEVRDFAREVASMLARAYPEELTVAPRKEKRGGRVFIDTARNAYAQTAVPPYAVRARPGATVAVPVEWEELSAADLRSDAYTIKNLFRRLAQKQDPWEGGKQLESRTAPLSAAVKLLFHGTRGYIEARTGRHRRHSVCTVSYRRSRVTIDCGEYWLDHLGELSAAAYLIPHVHPDHAGGLAKGAPCPVYATGETWESLEDYPIEERETLRPRRPFTVEEFHIEAFSVAPGSWKTRWRGEAGAEQPV